MSISYVEHIASETPQTEAVSPKQQPNNGGGFSFVVDDWMRLDRFLIMGSEGGSFYQSEKKLTVENMKAVQRCIEADTLRVINQIVQISDSGRAHKNEPALLALAACHSYVNSRIYQALTARVGRTLARVNESAAIKNALPKVARTATHLFHFAEYHKALKSGWGRSTRRMFREWYTEMPPEKLAYQLIKYQSRDGWSHRDLMRKIKPESRTAEQRTLFAFAAKGYEGLELGEAGSAAPSDVVTRTLWAFERSKKASKKELLNLIVNHQLPHECLSNEALAMPEVWEALLPSMGLTAMIRRLGQMTSNGALAPLNGNTRFVVETLRDHDKLRKARIHPMGILLALTTYASGKGVKGSLTWQPVQAIIDALDEAFYAAFKMVEPTGKRHLLALDVSGSMAMDSSKIMNTHLRAREASAAMALVTANVEESTHFMAFSEQFIPLNITPRQRLDDVVKTISDLPFAGTDCSLPMVWALKNKIPVDAFCVYTDNETNYGNIHPHVALERYRQGMGIPAKLVVVGMVANQQTIANPDDAGMMDLVGFDASMPSMISEFIR